MASRDKNQPAQINNRRALHDYFITHKIECGMVLVGTEVKSLREGKALWYRNRWVGTDGANRALGRPLLPAGAMLAAAGSMPPSPLTVGAWLPCLQPTKKSISTKARQHSTRARGQRAFGERLSRMDR